MSDITASGGEAKSLRRIARVVTSTPVRVLVSVGLLAAVALNIDWDALTRGLVNAAWGWYVLAVGLFFSAFTVGAVRWRALLARASLVVSWWRTLRANLIGLFSNNLLPTGYGGDAVRAWIVGRSGKPLARALTSVLVDRASGFICLLLIAWLAVVLKADEVPAGIVLLLGLGSLLVTLAGLGTLIVVRRTGLGRVLPDVVRPWTSEVAGVLRCYERDRGLLVEITLLGLVYQTAIVAGYWLVSESLGLGLDPAVFAVVVPTVLMAALLPISIAGFGVREGAFVVLLGQFGVAPADATLLSLMSVAAAAIASAPGGVAIAFDPRLTSRPNTAEPAAEEGAAALRVGAEQPADSAAKPRGRPASM